MEKQEWSRNRELWVLLAVSAGAEEGNFLSVRRSKHPPWVWDSSCSSMLRPAHCVLESGRGSDCTSCGS